MLTAARKRLIPVLLLDRGKRLVKTVRFGDRTYIGDPFNVVRIFNEKEVDEICILDIDATVDEREPDLGFIGELASECFMPMSYGGGLRTPEQCNRLIRVGVEKCVLGHGAFNRSFVNAVTRDLGSQAVVGCVDFVGSGTRAHCVRRSGRVGIDLSPLQLCLALQEDGVGEIILQSVDRDGTRAGFDSVMVHAISQQLDIPLVALGGAASVRDLTEALSAGASGAASGSAFVFVGQLRAVLVTYPDASKEATVQSASRVPQ